jgi:hypothetical protein
MIWISLPLLTAMHILKAKTSLAVKQVLLEKQSNPDSFGMASCLEHIMYIHLSYIPSIISKKKGCSLTEQPLTII